MRTSLSIPLLLALALAVAGCKQGPFADVDNPKTFEAGGLSFTYPGNWEVEASGDLEPQAGVRVNSVQIRGPGSVSILVNDFKQDVPMTAEQAVEVLMAAVQEEANAISARIQPGKTGSAERELLGSQRTGSRRGYTVTVEGETKEAAAEAWVVALGGRTVVVGVSAETGHRIAGNKGFEMVLGSLAVKK